MKQKVFSTKVLAEIAIFAALGLVLDALSSGLFRGIWVNGGSICIAMTTVFIFVFLSETATVWSILWMLKRKTS